MSFSLPLSGSAARDAMGDLGHVVEVLNPANIGQLPTFRWAIAHCREQLAGAPVGTRIQIVCLRANDERWLISVGKTGGWRRVWNFGSGR